MQRRTLQPVILRIRLVKVTKAYDSTRLLLFSIIGGVQTTLSVKDTEWSVYHLNSPDEEIVFRTSHGNASCLCRDLDGRKRLDFSETFSILIEGYWAPDKSASRCIAPNIPIVKEESAECEIAYMATREANPPDERESEDELDESNFSEDADETRASENIRPRGPVEMALAWMREPVSLVEMRERDESRVRLQYEPRHMKGNKIVWEPELTAMEKEPPTGVEPLIRAVDISQKLGRLFI